MGPRAPRLLVVATHPIQYHAPLFRALAASGRVDLVVGFLDLPDAARQGAGFGVDFAWDVPLTDGYRWVRLSAAVVQGPRASRFPGRRWRRPLRDLTVLAPDVVMVMGWNQLGLVQAWLAAKWRGLPLIVRGESNAKRLRVRWKRSLHRILLSLPDRYIAIGRSNRRFYLESGVADGAIADAPYFVDNAFFASRAMALDRTAQRAAWGIRADDVCVLFAGKFEDKKRPCDLLAAVAGLPEHVRARIAILMVGAGQQADRLRSMAQAHGLRAVWAGFLNQTEMPAAYAAADLLVLPSDHGETWGLVVNEAMACGVPAVVADQVGCADDLVRDGETGLVFPTADVAALGAAIARLVTDPELRRALGDAARRVVTNDYTVQCSVDAVVATVDALMRGPAGRSAGAASSDQGA
jgi:glycosyltransferase involved in cell wall biosynthesis